MGGDAWYSDREMFEMIQSLKIELTETRATVKRYNGLWEKFETMDTRLTTIEERAKGRSSFATGLRDWGGWGIAAAAVVVAVWKG